MSTIQTLQTVYSDDLRIDTSAIPSADATTLQSLSSQVDAGTLSLQAADAQVAQMAIGTTSVAELSYQFFTGLATTAGGLDYLVSPTGPNVDNLNSAYYQNFNLENRYINFAVNLGVDGQGAANFAAAYGDLSMDGALIKAYTAIFGTTPDAAKVDAILNAQVPDGQGGMETRTHYFAGYGGDGDTGIGTKAAMVGWLLAEAAKADVGVYAQANDAFLADLGPDGVAKFNTNLLTAYGATASSPAGVAISFNPDQSVSPTASDTKLQSTDGADTITGAAGLNVHQTVDSGNGDDVITIPGVVNGTVQAGDGNVTVTVGGLGSTPATLGVPAQYGSITLGSGQDAVHLTGDTDAGTTISAGGGDNTLYLSGGLNHGTGSVSVHGFQTVVVQSQFGLDNVNLDAAATIYDEVQGTGSGPVGLAGPAGSVVILKDTSQAVSVGAGLEVHLDHYTGAPTVNVTRGPGTFYQADGGSITVYGHTTDQGSVAPVQLHVDSDSTAGLIYGYDDVVQVPDLTRAATVLDISGSGALTAQVASSFTTVDASGAADLNLTYSVASAGVFTLSNGTDTLNLDLSTAASGEKFVLGTGTDTINVTSTLSNLQIAGQVVASPTEIDGFKVGTDHLNLQAATVDTGVQAYATGATSLTDAMIAVSAHVQAGHAAVFEYGGDTYVYQQNSVVGVDAGDGLIKLVGVTGLSVASGSATGDIHFG